MEHQPTSFGSGAVPAAFNRVRFVGFGVHLPLVRSGKRRGEGASGDSNY